MCLYPRLLKNRKYTQTLKNGGVIPSVQDERTLYVPVKCGMCIECKKQKAREWQVRLAEDIKQNRNGKFITLTISNENLVKINNHIPELITKERRNWEGIKIKKEIKIDGYLRDNQIATYAVRHFLERWRKKYGKSLRHWFITELGHNGTENIHLHGIIWTDEKRETVEKIWEYGYIWPREQYDKKKPDWGHNYVNDRTINYITKYITKRDEIYSTYDGIILTSAGIGRNYLQNTASNKFTNRFNNENTKEYYRTSSGHKIALPTYYRNNLYNDRERETLWINTLNKEERWILGNKISIRNGEEEYYRELAGAQKQNEKLGYNNNKKKWTKAKYENERRNIMQNKRINNKKNLDEQTT